MSGLPWLVFLLIFVGFAVRFRIDGDIFWHIKAGEWILTNHSVPTSDIFSFSLRGKPWTNFEWLSQVLFAVTYNLAGWGGLSIITALCAAAMFGYLVKLLQEDLRPFHVLCLAGLGFSLTAGHILTRPHMLALPILLYWVVEMRRASDSASSPSKAMLPLMVLWANLHGSFTLGLVFTAFFGGEAIASATEPERRLKLLKEWLAFAVLAGLASLLTPNGLGALWITIDQMRASFALNMIDEWRSPNFQSFEPMEYSLLAFMGIALYQGLRLSGWRIFMLLFLLHFALKSVRNEELLGLLGPIILAKPLAIHWYGANKERLLQSSLDRCLTAVARFAPAKCVMAASLLFAAALYSLIWKHYEIEEGISARSAVAAVQAAGIEGPVLNHYNFGGYLIFQGISPYVDSRAVALYDDAFLERCTKAIFLAEPEELWRLLKQHEIKWTLLPATTPAAALLDYVPGWKKFYADKHAVVHVRDDSVPATPH